MKAPASQQKLLLDLQDFDNRLTGLTRALREISIETASASIESELVEISPFFVSTAGELEDARAELARIEADVAMVDERVRQDNERLASSSSPKDIAGFEHELTTLVARKDELESAELAVMERIEEVQVRLDALSNRRDELSTKLSDVTAEAEQLRADIERDRTELYAERKALASTFDSDLLALYERQRERYGVGAALLRQGVSGGSGMALSAHHLEEFRLADANEVILCPDSNCILVRTEESGL